jgi:hypothetical protein
MKYRHELKYYINYQDYSLLRLRLNTLLEQDFNVTAGGSYSIRSLYFDDYYNNSFYRKYMGVPNRYIYRIRIYNQSDSTIKLEKKSKTVSYNQKETAPLTKENVYQILNGDYDFLLSSSNVLMQNFYHECVSNFMRPRVVIDYEREPYVLDAGNARITFDKNIRAGVEGYDIFNDQMPMIETLESGLLIMEVKYTEFLANVIRRIIPPKASTFSAISKYILCCEKTMHRKFSGY